jgi:hypothetical protein
VPIRFPGRTGLSCLVEGCVKPVTARSMCKRHYMRWRTHGDPLVVGKPRRTTRKPATARRLTTTELEGRIERDPNSGCWLWSGADSNGYGSFTLNGKAVKAHRFFCQELHGPIPPGMMVLHSCDTRACVNPLHLSVGTHRDNMADMARKGRASRLQGEMNPRAKLTVSDVAAIRSNAASSTPTRLSAAYGVSRTTISHILSGRLWGAAQ